jgi:hypothetical protein
MFECLWGMITAMCAFLLILIWMCKYFSARFTTKVDRFDERFSSLQLEVMKIRNEIHAGLTRIEEKLAIIDSKVGDLSLRVTIVETRMEERAPKALQMVPVARQRRIGATIRRRRRRRIANKSEE